MRVSNSKLVDEFAHCWQLRASALDLGPCTQLPMFE